MKIRYRHTPEAYKFAYKHYGMAGVVAYHLEHPFPWNMTDKKTFDWLMGDISQAIDELRRIAKNN